MLSNKLQADAAEATSSSVDAQPILAVDRGLVTRFELRDKMIVTVFSDHLGAQHEICITLPAHIARSACARGETDCGPSRQ